MLTLHIFLRLLLNRVNASLEKVLKKLGFSYEVRGEGSEGVPGAQPVIWSVFECSNEPKMTKNCYKTDNGSQVWRGGRGQTRFSQKPKFVGFFFFEAFPYKFSTARWH